MLRLGEDVAALGFQPSGSRSVTNARGYTIAAIQGYAEDGSKVWKYQTWEPAGMDGRRKTMGVFASALDAARWIVSHMEPAA
ncbi:hypothetical protein [Pseudomonas sp. RIT-PI-AD]|uniref:hypothetical protein n=1 Tax=Pseudomonas sp. RIT-PI-AD TaxID=3035294 RepID=UPI0021DA404B|nr:hypothetical protein [Pseudomonas sp. RIT-PI-AD]